MPKPPQTPEEERAAPLQLQQRQSLEPPAQDKPDSAEFTAIWEGKLLKALKDIMNHAEELQSSVDSKINVKRRETHRVIEITADVELKAETRQKLEENITEHLGGKLICGTAISFLVGGTGFTKPGRAS
ncbi:hypothetical protein F4778DRAFT_493718 [Xylariomycetidae sp. FL2044]|nr:hypothetical protein F4778DRAFT_493718 [Xylariomycetidae sp. FL2044]